MKKFIFVVMAGFLLISFDVNATYIGSSTKNEKLNKDGQLKLNKFNFDPDVTVDDDFYFGSLGKFDSLDKWGGKELTKDNFTITGTTFKPNGEVTGGTFLVNDGSSVDFFTLKAGSGYVMLSVDGSSGTWSTSGYLGGKGISHISIFEGGGGNITYPGSGGSAQVPEPATIFLLGSGLLGLFGYKKKFWKSKTNPKE
jgi:hypothetical protein